jgi:hypothetical protein
MNKYVITADSHAAPGFLHMAGKSELSQRFAASAADALIDYFKEEEMDLPGPIKAHEDGKSVYAANMLMVYVASPV